MEKGAYGFASYASLMALVVQASASGMLMRISRTMPGPAYKPNTVVLFTEAVKFMICTMLVTAEGVSEHGCLPRPRGIARRILHIIRGAPVYMVPALLYVCQPVLLITAATYMDAVSFQICNQIKIVPTALFSVAILGRRLGVRQWASLPVMATGVAFVTLSSIEPGDAAAAAGGRGGEDLELVDKKKAVDWVFGLCCSLAAGTSSGFASIYFEKHVKSRVLSRDSIWVKNIQLGMFGLVAVACSVLRDPDIKVASDLLHGYTWATYALVVSQSAGGLIVALVVKYADNILKGFAMALSVVLSFFICIPLYGMYPSPLFLLGLGMVCASVLMYNGAGGGEGARHAAVAVDKGHSLPPSGAQGDGGGGVVSPRAGGGVGGGGAVARRGHIPGGGMGGAAGAAAAAAMGMGGAAGAAAAMAMRAGGGGGERWEGRHRKRDASIMV